MSAAGARAVIHQSEWPDHPWLSCLRYGSDIDCASAAHFTWDAPAPLAALDRIVIQYRDKDEDWQDAIRADGAIFPGWNYECAVVGWFRDLGPVSSLSPATEFRALIPAAWDCGSIPPQAAVPEVEPASDWRIRNWHCPHCQWNGTKESAAMFHDNAAVSIACPACGHGLATVRTSGELGLARS